MIASATCTMGAGRHLMVGTVHAAAGLLIRGLACDRQCYVRNWGRHLMVGTAHAAAGLLIRGLACDRWCSVRSGRAAAMGVSISWLAQRTPHQTLV